MPAGGQRDVTRDRELINHHSSEITTIINNVVLFRIRSAFTVWIAPYIIFGAYIVATGGEINLDPTKDLEFYFYNFWLRLLLVSYLILGISGGVIEAYSWHRCRILNSEIRRICNAPSEGTVPSRIFIIVKSTIIYAIVFASLIVSFVAILNLLQVIFLPAN